MSCKSLMAAVVARYLAKFPLPPRRIGILDEDIGATGSVLDFPKRWSSGSRDSALEEAGHHCPPPRHLPQLKSLAHTKIHRTRSTTSDESSLSPGEERW
jgi:hypothetical protein